MIFVQSVRTGWKMELFSNLAQPCNIDSRIIFFYNEQMLRFLFVIPFYLQSVPVYSANCIKTRIQWHVEECSVAILCN
jgi:hypothetical protein